MSKLFSASFRKKGHGLELNVEIIFEPLPGDHELRCRITVFSVTNFSVRFVPF